MNECVRLRIPGTTRDYNKTHKRKRLDGCFLVMYGNWGSPAENVHLHGLSNGKMGAD